MAIPSSSRQVAGNPAGTGELAVSRSSTSQFEEE